MSAISCPHGGQYVCACTETGISYQLWHIKPTSLHEMLEDGMPPFHSIVALKVALRVHRELSGSMANVSAYTCSLARSLYEKQPTQMHGNFEEGLRCGNKVDEMKGKPTGVVGVSLGAVSSAKDISAFKNFTQMCVDGTISISPDLPAASR